MTDPTRAGYGSWKSPLTSDLIVSGAVGLTLPAIEGEDIYWVELRPTEAGRSVIVKRSASGETVDINPPPFNARTRVHEYGGGDYVVHQGIVYFSNFTDQQIYRAQDNQIEAITAPASVRYADAVMDSRRNRLICVREDHSRNNHEATNTLAAVDLQTGRTGEVLMSGNDFYSSPRITSDGSRLAWLTWNHPNMPWDGTELWIANINDDGSLSDAHRVAGGYDESIFQPEWSATGDLYFVSDRTGWWNIHRLQQDGTVQNVCRMDAEFGMPQWGFGMSCYAFTGPQTIVAAYIEKGFSRLALIDTSTGQLTNIDSPFTDIRYVRANSNFVVMRAGSPNQPAAIVRMDLASTKFEILRRSMNIELDAKYISQPRAVEFPTEGGLTAHGFYYAPKNDDFVAPAGELPPLLVMSHGGPTAAAATAMSLTIQYWTSRGIAVLDMNYGGSTGFGREYRDRLKPTWGIVDVDDCANGARHLVKTGEVDSSRLMITGGSAGGYTTLCALTFRNTFKAGASHYGVSDAEALAKETHKFESRYLDGLMGKYPEDKQIYFERSPINFTDRLSCPVIFFQGLEDKVVPPNQAVMMVEALRKKGIPVAYIAFEGEQHGFRQAKNIKRALDGELYFYSRVFDFPLADEIEPVQIDKLT